MTTTTFPSGLPRQGLVFLAFALLPSLEPAQADTVTPAAFLKASNPGDFLWFGNSVAVSGDTVVAGSVFEESSTTGVDSVPDTLAAEAGAAYVFVRSAGVWTQEAYLKASNTGTNDHFGEAVAIDGDTIVVGAPLESGGSAGVNGADNDDTSWAGAAYVFVRSGGIWIQQAYLKSHDPGTGDGFGASVAISGDTIAVGAAGERTAATGIDPASDDTLADAGAVYIFTRNNGVWSQEAFIKPSHTGEEDFFGTSVSLSGDTLAVGASHEDSGTTGPGGTPDESAADSGAVFVFTRNGGVWSEEAYLKPSNTGAGDRFGAAISLSSDRLAVGAANEDGSGTGSNPPTDESAANAGAVYLFSRTAGIWSEEAYLKPLLSGPEDHFGTDLSLSGDRLAVGAINEDGSATGIDGTPDESRPNAGAVFLFENESGIWSETHYVKATNTGEGDLFGGAVALGPELLAVGAIEEDTSGAGVDPLSDELLVGSGAVYLFDLAEPMPATLDAPRGVRFPSTPVGRRSRSVSLTLTNTGDETATGLGVRLRGRARRDFRIILPATSVAAGSNLRIRAGFRPRTSGTRSSTATFTAANTSSVNVALRGRGR